MHMRLALIPVLLAGCTANITDGISEIEMTADLIAHGQMSEEMFLEMNFCDEEILEVVVQVGILRGADEDGLLQEAYSEAPRLRGACTQDVEKANLSGDTLSLTHYINAVCDADPSDDDWLYQFYPTWADDANDYRWYASDWWVRTTLDSVYSGVLTGYTLCSSPVQLCLGTNGVTAAGGHNAVANNLFISH